MCLSKTKSDWLRWSLKMSTTEHTVWLLDKGPVTAQRYYWYAVASVVGIVCAVLFIASRLL